MEEPIRNGKTLSIAVLLDPAGSGRMTAEDELAELKPLIEMWCAPFATAIHSVDVISEVRPSTDVLFFDFGGIGGFGNSVMEDMSRAALQWALDNPSSVLAAVSQFTYNSGLLPEMSEFGLSIFGVKNVISIQDCIRENYRAFQKDDDEISPLPEWFFKIREAGRVKLAL